MAPLTQQHLRYNLLYLPLTNTIGLPAADAVIDAAA